MGFGGTPGEAIAGSHAEALRITTARLDRS